MPGGIGGDRPQGFKGRNALVKAQGLPRRRESIDRGRRHGQHANARNGCIVVQGEFHGAIDGRLGRANAVGPLWPQENIAMAIAPVGNVDREEGGHQPLGSREIQLVFPNGLGMDDDGTQLRAGIVAAHRGHRFNQNIGRPIAVGVCQEGHIGRIAALHPVGHLLHRHVGIALVIVTRLGFSF